MITKPEIFKQLLANIIVFQLGNTIKKLYEISDCLSTDMLNFDFLKESGTIFSATFCA